MTEDSTHDIIWVWRWYLAEFHPTDGDVKARFEYRPVTDWGAVVSEGKRIWALRTPMGKYISQAGDEFASTEAEALAWLDSIVAADKASIERSVRDAAAKMEGRRAGEAELDAAVGAVRKRRDRNGVLKIETEADLDRLVASHAAATADGGAVP
jgi:hypothetical protein